MRNERKNTNPNTGRGMSRKNLVRGAGRWARRLRTLAVPLAVLTFVVGCNELDKALSVDTPSRIPAEGLATPKNAELLVNGAVGDFECAFGAYVGLSAVLSHEMIDASQTADRWPYDRRDVHPDDARYATYGCESLGVYTPLSTARWSADNILSHLQEWTDAQVPQRQLLIAKAAAFAGYSYLLLGEGFCTMAIDESPEMQPNEVFQLAVDRFTTAIQAAQAAGNTDLQNLALVGRARANLDLGNGNAAVQDAQQVPTDFVYDMTASGTSGRRNNRIYAQNGLGSTGGSALSVGPNYRDLAWMGVADPRVPVDVTTDTASDNKTSMAYQTKYNSLSATIPIASGIEARLIEAEVQGGSQAVAVINSLHAAAGLPPFVGTSEQDIQAHVVQERARALWLTGHRFYDIRRLNLPLDPASGTTYRKGGTYGSTVCLPLPNVETLNNPNIGG